MQFALEIENPVWRPVITIPCGTLLLKGRVNTWYRDITAAAAQVTAPYGCYCWRDETTVFYVGSFSPYARKGFKSSFQARVHNYLQNHQVKESGRINTNKMVFDGVNVALNQAGVQLAYFMFENLHLGDATIPFDAFSAEPMLAHAVEELLIATYRRAGQCAWNRT